MFLTVFLGALIGVVVVAQTLSTATMEHSREFAMVKALGGRNVEIYGIIAEQAAITAVLGFPVGAALAPASRPVFALLELKMILLPASDTVAFLATLLLSIASSALS